MHPPHKIACIAIDTLALLGVGLIFGAITLALLVWDGLTSANRNDDL
jgi:hypothetical protein